MDKPILLAATAVFTSLLLGTKRHGKESTHA